MKYYLIEIANGDAKVAGKGIYEYDTLTDAVASFHKKLGTAMGSELYTEELVIVTDSEGTIYKDERFVAEV